MTSPVSKKYQPKVTARAVAQNVERLRKDQNLNIPELGRRLASIGHPMTATSITRLESGERRVDVDDLMALSMVLGVNPNGLLAPRTDADTEKVELTGHADPVMAQVLWGWLHAKNCLGALDDLVLFRRKALPRWLVEREEKITRLSELRNLQYEETLDELARRRVAGNGND